jgi:hypothetical protein
MDKILSKSLSISNTFTQEQIKEGISSWPKSLEICIKRANLFSTLQSTIIKSNPDFIINYHFERLENLSLDLEPLLREPTVTELEGYDQVHFTGNPWSGINSIPFALTILAFYKTYIVPGFGILIPILTCILPFILLKTFYNIPITFTEYTKILWRMWNGSPMPRRPEDLLVPPQETPTDPLTQLRKMAQNGWTLFSFGQAVWQPIQQARHFSRLDSECLNLGRAVLEVKEIATNIYSKWKNFMPSWLSEWIQLCPSAERQAFAFSVESPFWLPHLFRALGRFEFLHKLASKEDVIPVEFVGGKKPVLMIKDFGDPSISMSSRIVSSLRMGASSQQHAIVTGPNRGGKSSFMRGVLINVTLAHAFGAAFADKAQMSYFSWIADGLRLDDTPGETSMFEREVSFASSILNKRQGTGLILYDELFHSTNPPDAIRTSKIFCKGLWRKKNCLSIISTHIYELAREAPKTLVKPLCLATWKNGDDYQFSYTVQKGICQISSVDLVLEQYGIKAASF